MLNSTCNEGDIYINIFTDELLNSKTRKESGFGTENT